MGMPIAVDKAKKVKVIGFDLNSEKIQLYRSGIDPINEVGNEAVKNTTVDFTDKIRYDIFCIGVSKGTE